MRRGVGRVPLLKFLLDVFVAQALALYCSKFPENVDTSKSEADGSYLVEISGNPESYVPGEKYTGKFN